MKLERTLYFDSQQFGLVDEDIRLQLNGAGRASFTVQGVPVTGASCSFFMGYAGQSSRRFFYGYVERVTPVDAKHCKVFCREFAAILALGVPLNLRNKTLSEVLLTLGSMTGLKFVIGGDSLGQKSSPYLVNLGSGYLLMGDLVNVYNIDDYVWYQQVDGQVYVGSWSESFWNGKPVELEDQLLTGQRSNNTADIPPVPGVRPGLTLNGNRVQAVTFSHEKMTVKWN